MEVRKDVIGGRSLRSPLFTLPSFNIHSRVFGFRSHERRKKTGIKAPRLNICREMPPLYHKLPGEDFDWAKSEVCNWIVTHKEVRAFLWDKIAQSGLIEFNAETCKWMGRDYV